jgi:predicted  nucleic acid-binding Zn-ribbon protein
MNREDNAKILALFEQQNDMLCNLMTDFRRVKKQVDGMQEDVQAIKTQQAKDAHMINLTYEKVVELDFDNMSHNRRFAALKTAL